MTLTITAGGTGEIRNKAPRKGPVADIPLRLQCFTGNIFTRDSFIGGDFRWL